MALLCLISSCKEAECVYLLHQKSNSFCFSRTTLLSKITNKQIQDDDVAHITALFERSKRVKRTLLFDLTAMF